MRFCFCGNPVFGTDKNTREGYCKSHQYKRTDLDKRSIVAKAQAKYDAEKLEGIADEPPQRAVPKNNAELNRWFAERRKQMTGKCSHCGGATTKNSDIYFKHSLAHILPKAYFPSVATHPSNFIELCFWNKSCHTNFDNLTLDLIDLNCYDEVIEKFLAMYPSIDKKERKRIPEALMNYIHIDI